MIPQVLDAIRDPIDVLLASQYHLTLDAGALRACDHKQIWEPGDHDPEVSTRTVLPLLSNRHSGIRVNVDLLHGPRHGIKPSCKNDRIECVVGIGRTQPSGRNCFDRFASDIYQGDVIAIVRLIIFSIENEPLSADWMVIGA